MFLRSKVFSGHKRAESEGTRHRNRRITSHRLFTWKSDTRFATWASHDPTSPLLTVLLGQHMAFFQLRNFPAIPASCVYPWKKETVYLWKKKRHPAGSGSITCEFTLTCEPKTLRKHNEREPEECGTIPATLIFLWRNKESECGSGRPQVIWLYRHVERKKRFTFENTWSLEVSDRAMFLRYTSQLFLYFFLSLAAPDLGLLAVHVQKMWLMWDMLVSCQKTHANKWVALGLMVNSVISQAYLETKQNENQTREPTKTKQPHYHPTNKSKL